MSSEDGQHSLSTSPLDTTASTTKTAQPSKMLFGAWTHGVTGSHLVGGSDPPKEEEFFLGGGYYAGLPRPFLINILNVIHEGSATIQLPGSYK